MGKANFGGAVESDPGVKLGDGVADALVEKTNQYLEQIGAELLQVVVDYVRKKIQDFDLEKALQSVSKKDRDEIMIEWSSRLAAEGLIPGSYGGLSEQLLIANLQQEGYLDGIYAGYALVMMSLIDNGAPNGLVTSVVADVSPKLFREHYKDREEIFASFEDGRYRSVAGQSKSAEHCSVGSAS